MRAHGVKEVLKKHLDTSIGDVYEFGLFIGVSLKLIQSWLIEFDWTPQKIWGFDSFTGFPHSDRWEQPERDKYRIGEHFPGSGKGWNATPMLRCATVEEAVEKLRSMVDPRFDMEFVVGYFNESLPKLDVSKMRPAAYLDIDVDLYCSTMDLMTWMLDNKLIVPGTIIYYDDWGSTTGVAGESRAHRELCAEYKMKCQLLHQTNRVQDTHRVFKILSIG